MSTNELLIKETELSKSAREAMRLDHAGGDHEVLTIKLLSAALITQIEKIRDRNEKLAAREASIAITELQGASMWAVHASTKRAEKP